MLRLAATAAAIVATASAFSPALAPSRRLMHSQSTTALPAKKGFKVTKWADKIESGLLVDGDMVDSVVAPPPEPTVKPGALGADSMELYCKAAGDGSQGDCPFAHFVGMVLHTKGIADYTLKPTASDDKPDWLRLNHGGAMPCLVHKGEAFTESMDIAKYIDFFFPDPKLEPKGSAVYDTGASLSAGFMGKVKAFLTAADGDDAVSKRALNDALAGLDKHLAKNAFLGGDALSLADCAFAPQLQILTVGGAASQKNFALPTKLAALQAYADKVYALPAFVAASPATSAIEATWA